MQEYLCVCERACDKCEEYEEYKQRAFKRH